MAKNKLTNVNDILMEQLERLNDDHICADIESIQKEVARAEAMTKVTDVIFKGAELQLKAYEVAEKNGLTVRELPECFGPSKDTAPKLTDKVKK